MTQPLARHAATSRPRDGHVHAAEPQANSVASAHAQHNDRGAKPHVLQWPADEYIDLAAGVAGQPADVLGDQVAEVDAGPVPPAAAAGAVEDVHVAFGPLGEDLVGVLRRQRHDRPDLGEEGGRDLGVQEGHSSS